MTRVRMLGFALAALLAPAALRAQAIPVKPAGELSSLVGLPFDVPIVADMTARTERLGSFALRLTWDPAVLRFDTGVDGSFGGVTVNQDSLAAGVLRLAGASPSGAAGLVTLGIGRFTPIAGGTTILALTLSELYASGSFADLRPSAVVSDGSYCPALGRFGDVDSDGSANSRDALIALSNAVGLDVSAFDIALGDVDGNGATNARDALIILSSAVGLDVSGFRVLRLAGGSCALNPALTMSITPSPLDLVLGQSAQLEARAADGSGALQSLPDVVWKSSDPGVAAVTSDGRVLARSEGAAVITALRDFADSAQATITVIAGRSLHVVDAAAVNATNQLGSAALPFASIAQALAVADSGDTIEIRPGRYDESVTLDRAIVLLGDTLADGTRPLVTGGGPFGVGINLLGTGSRELHNLAFDNVDAAVEISGPDAVLLRGVRGTRLATGVRVSSMLAALRIERSVLIGNGVSGCCGSGIESGYYESIDTLVIEDTEIGDFDESAIYAPDLDTLDIRRSNLHDFGYYGLELGGSGQSLALVVDSSTVQRSYYELFYVQDLRSAVFTRNVLISPDDDMFYQYQENISSGGFVSFQGDSILCEDYSWIDISDLDSLIVDSVKVLLPDGGDGDVYNVPYVRVTRSNFLQLEYDALDVYGYAGGVVEVKNSTFVGDPRCDLCGSGLYVADARTTVDSSTFVNLYEPIYVYGDSSLTVTNSTFRRVEYGVQFYGNYSVGCTYYYCSGTPTVGLTMRNNTMNGFYYGVEAYDGLMTIEDNTFVAGRSFGLSTAGGSGQSVQRNVFDDVDDPIEVDLYDSSVTAVIADNVFTNVTGNVIYGYGDTYPDTIRSRFEILRNTIACTGSYDYGIDVYYADATVADNQITGCRSGVYLYHVGTSARTDSVLRNTLVMPPNPYAAVYASGSLRTRISGNVVTADTAGSSSYGDIWVQNPYYYYYYYAPGTTLVDSNVVSGGTNYGIYVADLDTAVVAQNTVTDVANTDYGYSSAIHFAGSFKYLAAIAGNTVRRGAGIGIATDNVDTATVQVDSNLVSASGAMGIDVQRGAAQITRNTVVNSGTDGIHVSSSATVPLPITLNNISGNVRFGLREDGQGVNAPNNWWGDPLGPRCATVCDSLSLGDSVTLGVSFAPPLTAPNGSSPPPAPRALPMVAARAPRVSVLRGLAAAEQLPPARASKYERPARTRPARAATPVTAPVSPARAQAVQARTQQLAARVAARGQVESRRAAEQAARERVVRERVDRRKSEAEQARGARRTERREAAAAQPARRP